MSTYLSARKQLLSGFKKFHHSKKINESSELNRLLHKMSETIMRLILNDGKGCFLKFCLVELIKNDTNNKSQKNSSIHFHILNYFVLIIVTVA